jgi:Amt family ammonium transporter
MSLSLLQDAAAPVVAAAAPVINAGDTAWVLTASALVMVMTVGLAFFYGGLVRPKNALNTMMMSMVALGLISVQWVLVGYSIAFGHGTPIWGGLAWLGFHGVGLDADAAYAATIPLQAHSMFQLMFAIITPALISGAIVERMKFPAYVLFILLWATFVYDPLAHWVWGAGGWLQAKGALDFAGGTVVHISAGFSALVAAMMLGPRKDFKRVPIVPHNVPLVLLGAGLLWFGWFGFNAGSALAANGLAALAFTNTNTAAAMAMVTWVCLDLIRTGKATAVGGATGLVVGLVAITPAAGYVTAPASLAIGALGVFVSYTAIQIRAKSRLDDSLDVFSCHGLAGVAGALLTGVFATKAANPAGGNGWLAGNFAQMGVQVIAILAAIAISVVGTVVFMMLLKVTVGVKAGVREQLTGLDLSEHGEEAYFGDVGGTAAPGSSLGEGVIVSTAPTAGVKKSAAMAS